MRDRVKRTVPRHSKRAPRARLHTLRQRRKPGATLESRQAAGAHARAYTHARDPHPPHHRAGERHTYIYTPQRVPTMFDGVALPYMPPPE